jgi:hypothetical protein
MFADPNLGSQQAYYWWDPVDEAWKPHYPEAEGNDLTRYTLDLCESGEPDGNNQCPDAHDFDVLTCTDGTRPVFYFEPGEGADVDKWLIKIQGGGDDCDFDCATQYLVGSTPHFGSAFAENKTTRNAGGIFSNEADNLFRTYNVVLLDKCVGDRNLGDTTVLDYAYTEYDSGPVYFHGYRIILGVLKQLERDFNLAEAEEIVFVTQSNGSNGAYHYIDRLSSHVTATLGIDARVALLAQSWLNPGPEVEYFFENGTWPANYSDIPSTVASPGTIDAPNSDPLQACGPGFDPQNPKYAHWLMEGRTISGATICGRYPWQPYAGVDDRAYATEDYHNGHEQSIFALWGVDNGVTEVWDESCVQAHPTDSEQRACRDSRHVLTHHLSTPVFFATQIADRNLWAIHSSYTRWVPDRWAGVPDGAVWSPYDMKPRVEKLAEVISGYESRSACADDDIAHHGFFIDNTVDHMAVVEMSKLTRQMKANSGDNEGVHFQLQEYLQHWLDPVASPTVQCLDSNDLYDVEFASPVAVEGWPAHLRCKVGYYSGGTQPYQICDDPGFGDPTNPALNRADARFICEGPTRLYQVFLPLVVR